ncbi:MAG: flagellar hook-length control protein FliK [Magnetococcales bacterium]|nr:flagellar hook-length control protein FliK [Magnetococcales bacterium]
MTPAKMSLFQLEPRSAPAMEKPTSAQAVREEADRFQEALRKAEARKPDARPETDQEPPARVDRNQESLEVHQRQQRELRELRTDREDRQEQSEQAQELQEAGDDSADARIQKEAAKADKGRDRRKGQDGREILALPVVAHPLPQVAGMPQPAPGLATSPVGGQLPPPPLNGATGPGGENRPVLPGMPVGQNGIPSPQSAMATFEMSGIRVMAALAGGDAMHSLQAQGGEEKNDFAALLRLAGNPVSRAAEEKPEVAPRASLQANAPRFAEDLADETGRLRVISRPGASEQVRITLNPRELGSLDMRLVVDDRNQVHLMITTDSEAARDLLRGQLPQLRESLARQALGLGEVTVHVEDGRGGQTAPEWGFQGGHAGDRREFSPWRGGGESAWTPLTEVEPTPAGQPVPRTRNVEGGGLSLIV